MSIDKKVVVLAGPSGSGKNAVINEIKRRYPQTVKLVTATTRTARMDEEDGKDYYFFSPERFDEEISAGNIKGERFVTLFGGTHYGIYLPDLQRSLSTASIVLAPVDLTGALWLKENHSATTIFIMPESIEEYRTRIHARNPEMSVRELDMRMHITDTELRTHAPQYDYRIVNGNGMLQETTDQVVEILRKEGYNLV
jgi:guanylate kinase